MICSIGGHARYKWNDVSVNVFDFDKASYGNKYKDVLFYLCT